MLKTAYASIKLTQEIWPDFTKRFRNPSSAESYESDLSEFMNLYQIDFLEIRSEMVKDYYERTFKNVNKYMYKILLLEDKDVDEIQVIGHSIAGVDLPYFSNIELCTGHKAKWIVYYWGKDEKDRMFNDLVECGISKDRINMKPALEFYDL